MARGPGVGPGVVSGSLVRCGRAERPLLPPGEGVDEIGEAVEVRHDEASSSQPAWAAAPPGVRLAARPCDVEGAQRCGSRPAARTRWRLSAADLVDERLSAVIMSSVVRAGVNLSRFRRWRARPHHEQLAAAGSEVVELRSTFGSAGEAQRETASSTARAPGPASSARARRTAAPCCVVALACRSSSGHDGRFFSIGRGLRPRSGQYPWPDVGGPDPARFPTTRDCFGSPPGRSKLRPRQDRPSQAVDEERPRVRGARRRRARPAHRRCRHWSFIGFCFAASGISSTTPTTPRSIDSTPPSGSVRSRPATSTCARRGSSGCC